MTPGDPERGDSGDLWNRLLWKKKCPHLGLQGRSDQKNSQAAGRGMLRTGRQWRPGWAFSKPRDAVSEEPELFRSGVQPHKQTN